MDNPAGIFILSSVLLVAICGVIYLVFIAKPGAKLNVQRYQTKWLAIENSLRRDNTASYHMAIINADKLLDQALRERHTKGKTMGERMKAAQSTWSNANYVWGAHKVRNQIAHEPDFQVSYDITLRALSAFKQGLKDLGAI